MALPECPVIGFDGSSANRSCTSCVMKRSPNRCFLALFATETMKAAPSGCCMIVQTSSTTRSLGLGSRAAAAHTVSVQTIAAAGRSSGSNRAEVEDRHARLVGQQIVSLVGEQVSQAAGGKGPQQARDFVFALPVEVVVKVPEAGSLPLIGVVPGQRMIEGGPAGGAHALPDHDLDQSPEAADALEKFLRIFSLYDEGVHALARNSRRKNAASRSAGHVRVLPPQGR